MEMNGSRLERKINKHGSTGKLIKKGRLQIQKQACEGKMAQVSRSRGCKCGKHLLSQQQKLEKSKKKHTFSRLYPFSCCRTLAVRDFIGFVHPSVSRHFCNRNEKKKIK